MDNDFLHQVIESTTWAQQFPLYGIVNSVSLPIILLAYRATEGDRRCDTCQRSSKEEGLKS